MARIRTIKPGHWSDKELAKLPLPAHLFWIGTWNFSDDEGVFEADPLLLKSQVFPRRTDIRTEQVEQWIDQLVKARFIIPFQHEEVGYYIHRTFKTHQKIDKPQPSKIPSDTIQRVLSERSTNDSGTVAPEGRVPDKEGKRKGRAKALSGSDDPPEVNKDSYFKLLEKLKNENADTVRLWNDIKLFIATDRPKFIEPYMDIWNIYAKKQKPELAAVDTINATRLKKFKVRIAEEPFDFLKILQAISKSDTLKGKGTLNWKVDFDWIFENDMNYLKILEGKYQ